MDVSGRGGLDHDVCSDFKMRGRVAVQELLFHLHAELQSAAPA